MNLSKNSWHTRWFNLVQKVIGDRYKYQNGTNLCHYIRVCFLWGGGLIVFVSAIISFLVFILFIGPFYGVWVGPFIVGLATAMVGIAYGLFRLAGLVGPALTDKLAPAGSALACAYEYAKGVKGRYCPMIKFDQ